MVNQIKLKFRSDKFTEVKRPDILIAGCGTGQHSIGTATRFKDAKVLAIDLSLSSLAYAKQTEELGIENLEYLQTDILDLCQLNKQFDLSSEYWCLTSYGQSNGGLESAYRVPEAWWDYENRFIQ